MRRAIRFKAFLWAWGWSIAVGAKWVGIFSALICAISGTGYLLWRMFGRYGIFGAAVSLLFFGITAMVAHIERYDDVKCELEELERLKDSAQYIQK
jgi:hypothetical protein